MLACSAVWVLPSKLKLFEPEVKFPALIECSCVPSELTFQNKAYGCQNNKKKKNQALADKRKTLQR